MKTAPRMIRVIRGRRGRRGRTGHAPKHEWNEDRTRVRFETNPGQWGEWSALLSEQTARSDP